VCWFDGRLPQRDGVKQSTLQIKGLDFHRTPVDGHHAVMMSVFDVVLEEGAEWAGGFQVAASSTGDHVDGALLLDGLTLMNRPRSLVAVNVTAPDDIHMKLFVQ